MTFNTWQVVKEWVRGPSHWSYVHRDCPTLRKIC